MRRLISVSGLLLSLEVFASCGCFGADVTLRDGTFTDADWSQVTAGGLLFGMGSQIATGGNPGAYRAVTISGPGLNTIDAYSISLYNNAFNPVNGAIVSVDYAQDFRVISNNQPDPIVFGIALEQGGFLYLGPAFTNSDTSWTSEHLSNLGATDFANQSLVLGAPHPYFAAGTLPINFGFYVAESSYPIGFHSVSGVDNWQVTLHVDVPEPRTGRLSPALLLALLALRRHLRRGA